MNHLDQYKFSTKEGFNSVLIKLRYEALGKYFRGESCLELGSADGEGTKLLLKHFKRVVAVDGSEKQIRRLKKEIKSRKLEPVCSLFENFETKERFDTVMLAHILEHVDDPVTTLKIARKFLKKNGVVIVDVPNARSIHRQVGVLMGMMKSEYSLNAADHSIGHQRVYDFEKIRKDIKKADLKIKKEGGVFLKPFSNAQMEKWLNKKSLQAFNEMGKRYADLAAEIYLICTP